MPNGRKQSVNAPEGARLNIERQNIETTLHRNDQTKNVTKSGNVKTSNKTKDRKTKYLKYPIKIATKHLICHFSGVTVNRIYS